MTYDDMTRAAAWTVHQDTPAAARLLKAMANPHRLRALCLMAEHGEISVGQIEARSGLSQSALSQHLARLRQGGLVKTRRDAQTILYSLNSADPLAVIATLARIADAAVTGPARKEAAMADPRDESWEVVADTRPGMEWNRHIHVAGTDDRVCFMAHSDGRDPSADAARAQLVASAPALRRALDVLIDHIDRTGCACIENPDVKTALRAVRPPIDAKGTNDA